MKIVLVFAAFVAIAAAAPAGETKPPVGLLQYDFVQDDRGQFSLGYRTADGLTVLRQGELQPSDDEGDFVLVQSGSEMYTAPDGTPIKLVWTADKDGYHATGDHLPVPPPAPAA